MFVKILCMGKVHSNTYREVESSLEFWFGRDEGIAFIYAVVFYDPVK